MYDDADIVINGAVLKYAPENRVQARGIDPVNDPTKRVLEGIVHAMKQQLGFDLGVDVDAYLYGADMEPDYRIDNLEITLRTFLEASGDFVVKGYEYTYDDSWWDYFGQSEDDEDE